MTDEQAIQEWWRLWLSGQQPWMTRLRRVFKHVPGDPRCRFCNAPFEGSFSPLLSLLGKSRSNLNPHFCRQCEDAARQHIGGVEIEISVLFSDIRGSTAMAERMSATEFGRVINRFFNAATEVLVASDAWLEKLAGDAVTGLFIPGFAGPDHPQIAIRAAQQLLRAAGYADPDGSWIEMGVGVHIGTVFIGAVGESGRLHDIAALGDPMNVGARLCAQAAPGEALASEAICLAAGLDLNPLEARDLQLRGRDESVRARVLRAA